MSYITEKLAFLDAFPWVRNLSDVELEGFLDALVDFIECDRPTAVDVFKEIADYRKRAETAEKQRHLEALLETK